MMNRERARGTVRLSQLVYYLPIAVGDFQFNAVSSQMTITLGPDAALTERRSA